MFEKEAKYYMSNLDECRTKDLMKNAFKVGAEFGYNKAIETCGGFLKTLEYKGAFRLAWDKASKEEHKKLLNLPNWNNDIFKDISGIDAEAEIAKED